MPSTAGGLTSLRLGLLAQGYTPIPVTAPDYQHPKVKSPGKQPFFKGWQNVSADTIDAKAVEGWTHGIANHPNTGLLCGHLVAVDIDVPVEGLATEMERLASAMLGATPLHRIGKAPKVLLCYRTATPMRKMETPELKLDSGATVQIEVLGVGQQVVGFGVHPATRAPYTWPDGTPEHVPLADLPAVAEPSLRSFLAAAEAVLRQAGGLTDKERDAAAHSTPPQQTARNAPAEGRRQSKSGDFFRQVNTAALGGIGSWLPTIFPKAKRQDGTGAWRVSSADLGRSLEEDISVHPTEGGQDFGTRQSCSPIDIVQEHGGAPDAKDAAFWLCERLGKAPSDFGWKQAKENKPHKPGDAQAALAGFDLTEDGIALAFTKTHESKLRYDHTRGAWYQWTGKAWRQDQVKLAFSWCRRTCRQLAKEAGVEDGDLARLARAATAAAVERFAQSDEAFAVTSSIWDSDPFLLGTPGGTVDLRTGEMREPIPEDHITKLTSVAPAAAPKCPGWLAFLHQVTNGDTGLIRFLRQWCGYCLTGDTREHALLFAHGPGGNGKTVFLSTVARIMGDYARTAAMDTFVASQSDRHPTDLAMLRGARLVTASETEEGRAWAETRIKALTGGDTITARFMRQDFFEFRPEFKLTIIGNHKPILRNVDEAARRRFNVVPFLYEPPHKDLQLEEKLQREAPGILRWMIEGCLDWQMHRLIRPDVVLSATKDYFSEQDTVHQWVEELCVLGALQSDTLAVLFKSWSDYALANGEKPGTAKWFSQTLGRIGCTPVKNTPGVRGKRGFTGIAVRLIAAPSHHESADDRED
jgi:P4 family phage/plasmid primase-like protien